VQIQNEAAIVAPLKFKTVINLLSNDHS
jgi:hypothetical protein